MTNHTTDELKAWYKATCDRGSYLDLENGTIGAIESKKEFAELVRLVTAAQNKLLDLVEEWVKDKHVDRDPQIGTPVGETAYINEGGNQANATLRSHIANVRKGIGQ